MAPPRLETLVLVVVVVIGFTVLMAGSFYTT
jgi:hypothetical protein